MTKKIDQLPAAAALDGTELVELEQAAGSVQTTTQDIADLASGGSGFSGAGTDITALLPLAKVVDAGPMPDGHTAIAALFNPNTAAWDDTDGGWVTPEWQTGHVTFVAAVGDLSDPDAAWINLSATETDTEITAAQYNGNGYTRQIVGPNQALLEARAVTGQTNPLFQLDNSGGTPKFTIGPNGEITTCNGVAVPIAGVAVNIAAIHAALVTLGLITT